MTVKWPVLALALLLFAPQQDFDRLFARAMELHQAGDLLGAIDAYKAALAVAPDRADAHSNLGAAYAKLGQYDDAVKEYDAALKQDPANEQIRMNMALAYYKSARPSDAIPHLKRVLSSDPDAKPAYLILADCYLQTGQEREIVSLLKPRESMFADDLSYPFLLGTALLHLGDTAEGQRYVDRVFGAGDSAEGHLLMGMAYLGQQDYKNAKPEFEKAEHLNPKLPTVHAMYGRSLLGLGDSAAAEREFFRELDLNINDFEANLQLGNMRKGAQKFDEASAYFERAVSVHPRDVTARKLLAALRLQTGRVEDAVVLLEGVEKDAPELVDVHVQLATAYNRLKRPEDAEREKAIVDRLNAEAAAKQKGKGGASENSQLHNSQLPMNAQLRNSQNPQAKKAKLGGSFLLLGNSSSYLGSFGNWQLGVDWKLGVAELWNCPAELRS